MIVQKYYSENEVERSGVLQTKDFKLSKHAQETIFNMFTNNIYSKPIDSVVREITSNCFDSHVEAGVDDPVIIEYKVENSQEYISFIDVGVGISPDRMDNIFSVYFESTKDLDNNQIGGYGLGGKTPLAYTDSFFIITSFNGIKYIYTIGKGKTSPIFDLLMTERTSDRNGTEIKIPIKPNDINLFIKAINQQLFYFENIIYKNFPKEIQNDFNIYRGKTFWYRGNNFTTEMHVCLGRVVYPIDFNALNIDPINIPVAIKLNIGEIPVGVSRENIEYNKETISHLKNKIKEVKKELTDMLDKQYSTIENIEDYYLSYKQFGNLLIDHSKLIYLNISSFYNVKEIKIKKYNSINIPNDDDIIKILYEIKYHGKRGKKNDPWSRSLLDMRLKLNNNIYYNNSDVKNNKKHKYTLSINNGKYYTIRQKNISSDSVFNIITNNFKDKNQELTTIQVNEIKEFINEIDSVVKKYSKNYDTLVVPDNFKTYKNHSFTNIADINDKDSEFSVRNIENNYSTKICINDLIDFKGSIFYGFLDDIHKLKLYIDLYSNFGKKKQLNIFEGCYENVALLLISKQNEKAILMHKNAYHIKHFPDKILLPNKDEIYKLISEHNFNKKVESLNLSIFKNSGFKQIDNDLYEACDSILKTYNLIRYKYISMSSYKELFQQLNIDTNYISNELLKEINFVEEILKRNKFLLFLNIREYGDFSMNKDLFEVVKEYYKK